MPAVPGKSGGQRGAALDVVLYLEHERLDGRRILAVADDVEGLYQRNAGADHRRQLPCRGRDFFAPDAAAGLEERPSDPRRYDSLTPQLRAQGRFAGRHRDTPDALAGAVGAMPTVGASWGIPVHQLSAPVPNSAISDSIDRP